MSRNATTRLPSAVPRGAAGRAAVALVLVCCSIAAGDWLTHRGSPQRTGNVDGRAAATRPAVAWVHKSPGHFLASPVPGRAAVYLSELGPFNIGILRCMAAGPDAPQRTLWSKSAPYLRRPTVCAPALSEGLLLFGDGMHQTHGAALYCLRADDGRPLWQLPLPGRDIRLECSPTVDKGRVYVGAGGAGVLCVDLHRVTLDGKEQDLKAAAALIDKRWAELLAKYEQDRKKDPTFAIPPDENALPRPAPRLLWQQGQGTWYVGAPVALIGDRLLVASQYLDDEKIGRRAVFCLRAADGKALWERAVAIDPWAGPTVAGDLVLVGCSSIRLDVGQVGQAKGEVVALALATGQVRWRRELPGGILSSIAFQDGLAVFAATDGKLRAWQAATGQPKWTYDAKSPFFAGPAVAGGMVYAADVQGVVHALALSDGKEQWRFDVTRDPAVQLPGMVFGSPVVHEGRIYLATCNIQGRAAGKPCAAVCISDAAARPEPTGAVAVDPARRTVAIACRIAPRKLPSLKEVYPIEVFASHPHPRGQKAHETVVTFEATPSAVHKALEQLGLKPGTPTKGGDRPGAGPEVKIFLEIPGPDGRPRAVAIENALVERTTGRPLPPLRWLFTGSAPRQPDPDKPDRVYGADLGGTLIAVFPVTDETVFQSNLTMKEEALLKLETNGSILPPEGTPAKLIIQVPPAAEAAQPDVGAALPGPLLGPMAPEPLASPLSRLAPVSQRPVLPPVEVFDAPRVLPTDPPQPVRLRPAGESPRLPPGPASTAPERPRLPAGPPARAGAPGGEALLLPPGGPAPDRPDVAVDAALRLVQQIVPAAFPHAPAPFLPLTIPDPFGAASALRLHPLPPDDDEPAADGDAPPRPRLPTSGPAAPGTGK